MTEAIEGKLYLLKQDRHCRGFEPGKIYMITKIYQRSKNLFYVDWLFGMQTMQRAYYKSEFDDKFRQYVGQEI